MYVGNYIKRIRFEIKLIYAAENTLNISCQQISGLKIEKITFRCTIYSLSGFQMCTINDVFTTLQPSQNIKSYSSSSTKVDSNCWEIIKDFSGKKPSPNPIDVPWIFEIYLNKNDKFPHLVEKSNQLKHTLLIKHFLNSIVSS
jgi:hypothetical protein